MKFLSSLKEMIKDMKGHIKELKESEEWKEFKQEMKEEWKEFKDETQEELKEIKEDLKESVDSIKEGVSGLKEVWDEHKASKETPQPVEPDPEEDQPVEEVVEIAAVEEDEVKEPLDDSFFDLPEGEDSEEE